MAIQDEIRHQRQRLRGRGVKAYISYYLTYYLWTTIAVICVVVGLLVVLVTMLSRKEQVLGVMFLNASTMSVGTNEYGARLEEGFAAYAGIDTGRQEAVIDTSCYQTPGLVADSYDMSTSEKVAVQAAAGMLDCVVADASNFYYYTCSMAFEDLRDVLSEETLTRYEDEIYYVDMADVNAWQDEVDSASGADALMTEEEGKAAELAAQFVRPDPDTMEEPVPVGIIVTDAAQIAGSGVYTDRVAVLGFVQNSEQHENAALFLDYLFEE